MKDLKEQQLGVANTGSKSEHPIIDITTLFANVYVDNALEDTIQISGSTVDIQINDVLSGKDIRVEFLATYDLNDGFGPQVDQVIGTFYGVLLFIILLLVQFYLY